MRLPGFESLGNVPATPDPKLTWVATFFTSTHKILREIEKVINGGITFGDGTSKDNIAGVWVTVTSDAIANTEFAVTHNLGDIPPGFITMKPPASGHLYRGTTAWTTTTIYLKCTAAAQEVTLFVLGKPQTI